jgi:uncharacterized membrane protein
MRIAGIILIVIGIAMMAFNGFRFTTEKKVVDLGPLEINKKESHPVSWPSWTGGLVMIAGIGLVVAGRRK